MAENTDVEDTRDWSQYPPDRVEGLKYFYNKSPKDEAGPATEEELKKLCVRLDCKVEMYVDNFLFWLMKKTKERDFKGNDKKFKRKIPLLFDNLRTSGLGKYNKYQEDYAEENRKYMQRRLEWRQYELLRMRYLDKLSALTANWTCSSDEDDSDSESEVRSIHSRNAESEGRNSKEFNFGSETSVDTVINLSPDDRPLSQSLSQRYNSYLETDPDAIQMNTQSQQENIVNTGGHEESVGTSENVGVVDSLEGIGTQTFLPAWTSTQQ